MSYKEEYISSDQNKSPRATSEQPHFSSNESNV